MTGMQLCRADGLRQSAAMADWGRTSDSGGTHSDLALNHQSEAPLSVTSAPQTFQIELHQRCEQSSAGRSGIRDRFPEVNIPDLLQWAEWVKEQLELASAALVP